MTPAEHYLYDWFDSLSTMQGCVGLFNSDAKKLPLKEIYKKSASSLIPGTRQDEFVSCFQTNSGSFLPANAFSKDRSMRELMDLASPSVTAFTTELFRQVACVPGSAPNFPGQSTNDLLVRPGLVEDLCRKLAVLMHGLFPTAAGDQTDFRGSLAEAATTVRSAVSSILDEKEES